MYRQPSGGVIVRPSRARVAPGDGSLGPVPARLAEIARNLGVRIAEARANGWLGEVQGLQTSLDQAREKVVALDRLACTARGGPVAIGMPVIPPVLG